MEYKLAYIREQGVVLIIIPLDESFKYKSDQDKNAFSTFIQGKATNAGLKGTVVLVWPDGRNMGFLSPPNFQPFFKSINLQWVMGNLNKTLSY